MIYVSNKHFSIQLNLNIVGNLLDESEVLDWMIKQKEDESIEEIDRDELFKYIETKEFLAVVFCKFINNDLHALILFHKL